MGAKKVKVYVWVCEKCGYEWESVGIKEDRCPKCYHLGHLIGEYEEWV